MLMNPDYHRVMDLYRKLSRRRDLGIPLLDLPVADYLFLKSQPAPYLEGWFEISTDRLDIQDGILAYAWEIPVCLEG